MSQFILIEHSFYFISRKKASMTTVSIETGARDQKTNGKYFQDKLWEYEHERGDFKHKTNIQTWRKNLKNGREKKEAAEWRQEVRVTAVEVFDLRFLINEDYGPCACVSPDYGSNTRRHGASRRVANKTALFQREVFCTTLSGCS